MVSLMNREWIPFVVLFLTAGVVVGYASSYEEISRLQSEISTMTTEFSDLNVVYEQLEDDYSSLNSTHNELKANCTLLQSEVLTLTTNYDNLNATYSTLLGNYRQLEDAYELLNGSYTSLNSSYSELQMHYEEATERIAELEQMVDVLLDREYYQSVKDDMENASETILVAMYSMIYDPGDLDDWANDLIRELVNAKDRGVNVTVIIENRTYFGYMNDNLEAYQYLSENNVTVQLDNEDDTDHMKLVIIDDNIVYVGSHNWSESGLYYNHETSVKIVSEDIAEIFTAYFETI
ncbi:phospholipase [Candidatus Bathyarchaeota archaeon]|nr:MAG: phospholipase [Candidatus Bathyarchaeota archaeon]